MKSNIVFLEHKPFMCVELLGLLKNYQIICYNDDPTYQLLKEKWNIMSYGNTKFSDELESDQAVEVILEDNAFLDKVIEDRNNTKALLFYMTDKLDQKLKDVSLPMALPPFELQEQLGDKLNLPAICKRANVRFNESIIFEKDSDREVVYEQCLSQFGLPFVVQGSEGASGSETFFIESKEELDQALTRLQAAFKVSLYLKNNIPISVHACLLDDEVIIRGPYLQLLGLPELSHKPFQFSGNDTNQSLFTQELISEVREMSVQLSEYVKSEGYRGILGIDYLWDTDNNKIYTQEFNTRLVGLTRLFAGMQKDQGLLPDLVKHVQAFGSVDLSEKSLNMSDGEIDLSKHGYAQLIIRNNVPQTGKSVRKLDPSIYRIINGELVKIKSSLFVEDMEPGDILVGSSAYANCELYPSETIARIILKQTTIQDGKFAFTPEAVNIIETIRNYVTKE